MKNVAKTLFVFSLLASSALVLVTPALAQNQLTLNDGLVNSFLFGGGSNHISVTVPTMNCPGGSCILAAATAQGTGELSSSGTYSITTPATIPVMGGFDGGFFLTVRADGSSQVTQTQLITLTYNSAGGTLTGLINLSSVSPSHLTSHGYQATATGTFSATGGSFAQFFPNGGNVTLTLGITNLPLQTFPIVMHAFSPLQFENGTIVPNTACTTQSSNSSNFNGTPIAAGNYIWFNANFQVVGNIQEGTTLNLTNANIQFSANGNNYTLPAPNATVTFSASYPCASTSFNAITNTWVTNVPLAGSDEVFLDGLSYPVPAPGLPGGINPIVWTGDFSSNVTGLAFQWKWGAAVYTQFSTTYNLLGVKATHTNDCTYNNSDHAGTPEGVNSMGQAWKNFVIGGARGGGGSNWTGSWTGTVNVTTTCQAR